MFERKLVQFLLLGLIAPGSALALGLGEIHLKSALNSPLDAEIARADELQRRYHEKIRRHNEAVRQYLADKSSAQ